MNNRLRLLDYFYLTRPILFFPGWATLLAGYALATGRHQILTHFYNGTYKPLNFDSQLALAATVFTFAMGGCFVFNQLYDIDTDTENKKLFLIGEGLVSLKAARIESIVLMASSIILAAWLNTRILAAIVLFDMITALFYNIDPFKFKDRPLLGLLANMAMGWLAFAIGWSVVQALSLRFLLFSLPYLFFNTALYFLTTLPDMKGDAQTGKITFPIRFGSGLTINLCISFFLLAFLMSVFNKDEFMVSVAVVSLPFMIYLAWRRSVASAIISVKAGIATFAILVSIHFPLLLVMMSGLFFLTRYYYRNRFDFDYPNFKGR